MRRGGRFLAGMLSSILILAGSGPAMAKDKEWELHFDAGVKADDGGNYAVADNELADALKATARFQTNDPRLAQTYYQVGRLKLNEEDWPTAKDYFERALKVQERLGDPQSVDIGNTLSGLATADEQLGDHQMAVLLMKRVRNIWIKQFGASDERLTTVLPAMATYAMLDSDYATARQCYQQLVDIQERKGGRGLGRALNSLASCLAYIGKYAEAEPIAQKAVAILTEASERPELLDSANGVLQYIEQGLGKVPQVAQANPPQESQKAAQVLPRTKAPASSLKVTGTIIAGAPLAGQLKPGTEGQQSSGQASHGSEPAKRQETLGHGSAAKVTLAQKSATQSPPAQGSSVHGSSAQGSSQQESQQASGKIQYLAGGKLISPEQFKAMTLANNAYELIREEKYTMAIAVLKDALLAYPDLVSAHSNLGLAYCQLGRYDDALAELKKAIAIDASRPAAWLNLASTYQLSGKLKDADSTYGEFVERFPSQKLAGQVQQIRSLLDKELKDQAQVAGATSTSDYLTYTRREGTMRWPENKGTLKVYIASAAGTPGYKDEYAGFLAGSFENWQKALSGKVKFQIVKSAGQADIECAFSGGQSVTSAALEGGETKVDHEGGKINHALITIFTRGAGSDAPVSSDQIRQACLHEIGHALGLCGHSPDPSDVMFCSVPPASVKVPLSARDAATIQKLYAGAPEVSWLRW